MLDYLSEAQFVALIGLAGGIVLGLAARCGRFCTLGAIEDLLYGADDRRIRTWGIAIGTAVISAHLAMWAGLIRPEDTAYVAMTWSPLATIVGALLFGYGMALSGNCGYGALARLGGGDLRSLVIVVVMGVSAYILMSGPLAQLRVAVFPVYEANSPQSLSLLIESRTGLPAWVCGVAIGLIPIGVAFSGQRVPMRPRQVFWGAMVGLAIVSGWIGTQWIADVGFSTFPARTHTFAAPLGETLIYLMTASGTPLSFGVGSIFGVLLGALIGALLRREFRWEACDDSRELKRQILGAAMMGAGAILAFGCSIGQGVSAFSVLAYSAPLTLLLIFAGAALGLRHLIVGYSV
ncbi:YeeE/YedE family protein [Marinibacterium profundimaris]|uniref:YeeE/YedE family protein n=1 Tax=Marinibacterium profundimaris TaxID=1679460 RepID=A0A225NL90_9RHOB|nr:YeeE/YedE family protein [Marinibacterium profundimaris]OWU72831.1 YeeE/YedE family protein [Marinibacterium profundimaris]